VTPAAISLRRRNSSPRAFAAAKPSRMLSMYPGSLGSGGLMFDQSCCCCCCCC
jgi:hypothetical protein